MVKKICIQDHTVWHKWFAWYPVDTAWTTTDGRHCWIRYWLITVERRVHYDCGGHSWEYREIES